MSELHDDIRGLNKEIEDLENRIDELEQQITELKESQKQKQIIRLCNRLDKAEQQNKQMLELLIKFYKGGDMFKGAFERTIESITGKKIEEIIK